MKTPTDSQAPEAGILVQQGCGWAWKAIYIFNTTRIMLLHGQIVELLLKDWDSGTSD